MGFEVSAARSGPHVFRGVVTEDVFDVVATNGQTIDDLIIVGAMVLRLTASAAAAVTLNGIVSSSRDARPLTVIAGTNVTITIAANAGTSAAANRFGSAAVIAAGSGETFKWDQTVGSWLQTSQAAQSTNQIQKIAFTPVSVTDAAPGASVNNYSPTGYVGGSTNRLIVTAAAGGTTLTGLSATGVTDGWPVLIFNPSTTDSITLSNQSASSTAANRFAAPGNGDAVLGPQSSAQLLYLGGTNRWIFI